MNITDMQILDEAGQPRTVFDFGESVRLRVKYEMNRELKDANFVAALIRSDGVSCCNYSSLLDGFQIPGELGEGEIELVMPPIKLVADLYAVHIVVWDAKFQQLYGAQIGGSFHVRHELFSTHFGVYHENAQWSGGAAEHAAAREKSPIKLEMP